MATFTFIPLPDSLATLSRFLVISSPSSECKVYCNAFDRIQMTTLNLVECKFSVQSTRHVGGSWHASCRPVEKDKFRRMHWHCHRAQHCAMRLEVRIDNLSVSKGRKSAGVAELDMKLRGDLISSPKLDILEHLGLPHHQ